MDMKIVSTYADYCYQNGEVLRVDPCGGFRSGKIEWRHVMPRDYLPSRESELVTWCNNFAGKLAIMGGDVGVTPQQSTDFTVRNASWVEAYNRANDPLTRSPTNIVAKNAQMDLVKANARVLAGIIQKNPNVSNTQRSELGLTVKDVEPSPVPAPSTSPDIDIVSVTGRRVKIRLHSADGTTRRGRPAAVAGATLFSFVGETPSPNVTDWTFVANTTKTTIDVPFASTIPAGATVWLTAFWYNAKAQSGPACNPVSTNLQGGMTMAA